MRRTASGPLSRKWAAIRPSGMPTSERDDQRVERQLERRSAEGGQHLGDRPVVGDRGAEVAVEELAQVLDVLRRGPAGRSRPRGCAARAASGGSRPPRAAVIGSPVSASGRRPRVTRMKMVGNDQQEPDDDVAAEAAAAATSLSACRGPGRPRPAGRRLDGRRRGHVSRPWLCGGSWLRMRRAGSPVQRAPGVARGGSRGPGVMRSGAGLLGHRPVAELEGGVERVVPWTPLPTTATCEPCRQRQGRQVPPTVSWICSISWVRAALSVVVACFWISSLTVGLS